MRLNPIFNYVGGKRRIVKTLFTFLPTDFKNLTYCEPFIGGGALLLYLKPQKAIINDIQYEVSSFYSNLIKESENMIANLDFFPITPEFFYQIRNLDRDKDSFLKLPIAYQMARTVYLTKLSFNGIGMRTNSKGEKNAAFKFNKEYQTKNFNKPLFYDFENIRNVANYFKNNSIKVFNTDFEKVIKNLDKNSFIYCDPPYDPEHDTKMKYSKEDFQKTDHERLKKSLDSLNAKGIKWMVSNSKTDFILDLYKNYIIEEIEISRTNSKKTSSRKKIKEILIRNYSETISPFN